MGTRAPGRGVRGEHPAAARGELPLRPGESTPSAARDNRFLLPNAWGALIRTSCKSARFCARLSLCTPRVKGANNRVAAPLGEGWEDERHGLLFSSTLLFGMRCA